MSPYLQFLVSLGAWAQNHQTLVIAACVTIVFLLGGVKLAQHTSFFSPRSPRL
jgi:hypothetical protein